MNKAEVISIVIAIVGALFFLSALVLMWLVNIVLAHFGAETLLNYPVSLAITALLWLFGGAVRGTK